MAAPTIAMPVKARRATMTRAPTIVDVYRATRVLKVDTAVLVRNLNH